MGVGLLPLAVLLGHSAHPLRDSWPERLAGLVALVAAPAALLARCAARRPG